MASIEEYGTEKLSDNKLTTIIIKRTVIYVFISNHFQKFPPNFKEALTDLCKQPTVLEIS